MKTISIAGSALMLCTSAMAGFNLSIEKDVFELGITASIVDNTYLFIGTDSTEWLGVGIGYHTFITPSWKVNGYYEYGLENDWLLNEMVGIDGIKTNTHFYDISATRYFDNYSAKIGVTTEFVRNGFTWLTVDDANKYSAYLGMAKYFDNIYLAGRYEYHYAQDKSDMVDFNQGAANEWELSIGAMRPIWDRFYPYGKLTAFSPNGTYYGMNSVNYSWSVGGMISWK